MIKGIAITPPVVGRISIGKVIERNGKRLPQKDDGFTITTQVQNQEGWVLHPLDEQLRNLNPKKAENTNSTTNPNSGKSKLRSIPVKVLFNDPDLNLRADYCLFDRKTGRAECVGNGEACRRQTAKGVETLPCPSPDQCQYNQSNGCKPYGRLNVVIDAPTNEQTPLDELSSFVFRTTGYNSIRTLAARLSYLAAVSGGHLATLPLELRLRGKSTTQSHRAPIFYADLVIRSSMSLTEAITQAKQHAQARLEAGVDQRALDEAARIGLANGMFEDTTEEGLGVVEEFYPKEVVDGEVDPVSTAAEMSPARLAKTPSLAAKLENKAQGVEGSRRVNGRTPTNSGSQSQLAMQEAG
ncbi:hypothetical protein [Lampropedia aestuarii]|uniref:recombination directionality factor n=1 Tax=Lampropedia aestuarii TaxID=2562762 RepID=UPI00246951D8|nr:hypothetical protein [Lampropedia aestuarii]MDH5858553.1 hypothetical protein [Lampropedia aestuarii]